MIWATNLPAPYRLPVWRELSRSIPLSVWLLARNEFNREWSLPTNAEYDWRRLPTAPFRRGEDVYYAILPGARLSAGQSDAIILPGWSHPAAWQLLTWAKARGIATLAFNESTLLSQRHAGGLAQRGRSRFYTEVDHVITVSPGSTAVIRACGVEESRLSECSNAVDVAGISRSAAAERLTGAKQHTFLFCGQLIERKQPRMVVEALARMPDATSTLLIAGQGPETASLKQLIESSGLQDRVTLAGYLEPTRVWAEMGNCQTLVMPSKREVHGLVAAEALAAGMQVVLSDRAGVSETVRGMPGVWITPPELGRVADSMAAAAVAWRGPVANPPMLRYTPALMAGQIAAAVQTASLSAQV